MPLLNKNLKTLLSTFYLEYVKGELYFTLMMSCRVNEDITE